MNPEAPYHAALLLQDGSLYHGHGFGAPRRTLGEVVFNTGMVGYTEALTDPSYRGQILTFTYPLLGNYGVPPYTLRDPHGLPTYFESDRIQTNGIVLHELCDTPSHWASTRTLAAWLADEGIPGITGLDTRMLTKQLRVHGVMMGALEVSQDPVDPDALHQSLHHAKAYGEQPFVADVTCAAPRTYAAGNRTIALLDCGAKNGILRQLLQRNLTVLRLPYNTPLDTLLAHQVDGIVVSNGPGDPQLCRDTIQTLAALRETTIPVLGICLGVQLMALSLGARTYKLRFGHRGQNKPCTNLRTGLSYVTSQNHGYAVDPESLTSTGLHPWFINADDGSIEGLWHENLPWIAVQFHPEASPGPYDTAFIFDEFQERVEDQPVKRR